MARLDHEASLSDAGSPPASIQALKSFASSRASVLANTSSGGDSLNLLVASGPKQKSTDIVFKPFCVAAMFFPLPVSRPS